MPYIIRPQKGKFEVVSKTSGKVKGTHSTRQRARQQQKALYAAGAV